MSLSSDRSSSSSSSSSTTTGADEAIHSLQTLITVLKEKPQYASAVMICLKDILKHIQTEATTKIGEGKEEKKKTTPAVSKEEILKTIARAHSALEKDIKELELELRFERERRLGREIPDSGNGSSYSPESPIERAEYDAELAKRRQPHLDEFKEAIITISLLPNTESKEILSEGGMTAEGVQFHPTVLKPEEDYLGTLSYLDLRDEEGKTLLIKAAQSNNMEAMRLLLTARANPNISFTSQSVPSQGYFDDEPRLGGNFRYTPSPRYGTPLTLFLENTGNELRNEDGPRLTALTNMVDTIRLLLEESKANPNLDGPGFATSLAVFIDNLQDFRLEGYYSEFAINIMNLLIKNGAASESFGSHLESNSALLNAAERPAVFLILLNAYTSQNKPIPYNLGTTISPKDHRGIIDSLLHTTRHDDPRYYNNQKILVVIEVIIKLMDVGIIPTLPQATLLIERLSNVSPFHQPMLELVEKLQTHFPQPELKLNAPEIKEFVTTMRQLYSEYTQFTADMVDRAVRCFPARIFSSIIAEYVGPEKPEEMERKLKTMTPTTPAMFNPSSVRPAVEKLKAERLRDQKPGKK